MFFDAKVKIVKIACGSNHTLAIDNADNVWSWGLNVKGQCGQGDFSQKRDPAVIKSISPKFPHESILDSDEKVKQVACGSIHSLVLTSSKRVFSFGYGEN
mmetsp:Transcript_106538/g.229424  ORF Transcript_106538/g.229424 Transcript_106538/m.229424 type:complete len:100 (+) Transcript_106538:286-585(+)